MKRYHVLICLLIALAFAGCASGVYSNTTPQREYDTSSGFLRPPSTSQADAAKALPGIYLKAFGGKQETVVGYQRTASGNAAPSLSVDINGDLAGVDQSGQLYSWPYVQSCGPCYMSVYTSTGKLSYKISLPYGKASNQEPYFPYVDVSGRIYFMWRNCSKIYVMAPGRAGSIERIITIPKGACNWNDQKVGPDFPVFGDRNGGIYLRGTPATNKYQLYMWAPGAKGNAKPSRTISGKDTRLGVQGVDSSGNIWTAIEAAEAFVYGPTASGPAQPKIVPLNGVYDNWEVRIAANNQLVYVGNSQSISGPPVLKVAPPGGGVPVRTIKLPTNFQGSLWSLLF